MSRSKPHVIETKSRDYLRSKIDDFYENGDALFREISERDYGVDAIIELFENGYSKRGGRLVALFGF